MTVVVYVAEKNSHGVLEVVVPDLGAALAFYRRLGFTTERETPTFVTLRWDTTLLFVAHNSDATTVPRWASLRIIVPDVNAI